KPKKRPGDMFRRIQQRREERHLRASRQISVSPGSCIDYRWGKAHVSYFGKSRSGETRKLSAHRYRFNAICCVRIREFSSLSWRQTQNARWHSRDKSNLVERSRRNLRQTQQIKSVQSRNNSRHSKGGRQ